MDILYLFLYRIFDTSSFPPRWHCGEWSEFHGWLYIGSNLAIWSAYFVIPVTLLYFTLKKTTVLPYQRVINLFIAFILFCGITHLMDAIIFWEPLYRLNALFLFITGGVSWATAITLIRVIPKALEYKSPAELQKIIAQKTEKLKIANQKLEESEMRFKTLVNNNPDLISQFNKDLEHTFVNQSILNLTNQNEDAFIGKKLSELAFQTEEISIFEQNLETALKTGEMITYESVPGQHKNWEGEFFLITIVPIKNEANEVESAISVTREITQLKKTENDLRTNYEEVERLSKGLSEKNKQLENFAYIVSHNLRSPLGNLNALFELYQTEEDADEKAFLFEKLEQVVANLNSTISDLTDVVQIRQNTAIGRSILQFKTILTDITESIYTQIEAADIAIIGDFEDCPKINYPKAYLDSIIQNLLTNGVKYRSSGRKSKIQFKTWWNEGRIILEYQDNGLGIDLQRYGKKIFGLNKTFHSHPDARGVGLFITKNQIEALGGSITVESEVGDWTRFTIVFDYEASHLS